jgi:hypothetical protein
LRVHDTLTSWGHDAKMIDTTRVPAMGVAHHKRKNDALDAEAAARAVDQGRIPEAHILSPARRAMRAQLSVRGALVETRAQLRALAIELVASVQGTMLLANTLRSSALLAAQLRRVERWLDGAGPFTSPSGAPKPARTRSQS